MAKVNNNGSVLAPAKKDADGEKPSVILQQITVRPIQRGTVDLSKWRKAIQSFEATNPRRVLLYDLLKDVMLDAHVVSVVNKRIMGVTNADWVYFDKTGKELASMMEFIDTPAFEELVGELVNSKMWGYTMVEMTFRPDNHHGVWTVPRKHMRPENGMIMYEQNGFDGFSVREGRYKHTIIEAGKPDDLGLLTVVAAYAILKRGNISDWAGFAEVFGTPIIKAMWDGFNEDQRIKLNDAINGMGNGGSIVHPQGTEIEALNTGSAQNTGDLWEKFTDKMNKEISKAILGQTETTESTAGSGYAQAKQHGETEDDINKSDIKFVRQLLNQRLIPMMEAHGIDTAGGYFAIRNYGEEQISLKDRVEIDRKLVVDMKLPMGDDYLYDRYGVEKPANYNELKAAQEAAAAAALAPPPAPDAPPPGKKPVKKEKEVKMSDRSWLQKLRDVFTIAPEAGADISTLVADIYGSDAVCCTHDEIMIQLSMIDDATMRRWYDQAMAGGTFDNGIFKEIAEELTKGVAQELKIDGPRVTDPTTPLYENLRENIYRFSHAKTTKELESFNKALQESSSFAQFRNRVIKIDEEYNEHHLRTEYNTAQAMAQSAKQIEYLSRFDMIEIRTVGDDRVRHTHALLDGVILPFADIVALGLVTPFDWNCRCILIGAQGKQERGRDRAEAFAALMKPYFKRNTAMTQEAFAPEHPHFKDAPDELRASDYNLPEAQALVNDPNLPEVTRIADQDTARALWQSMGEEMAMNDGVRWNLFGDIAAMLTDGRWRYVSIFRELLTTASEIWAVRRNERTYKRVVKYYRGQPVVMQYPVDSPTDWTIEELVPDAAGRYLKLDDDIRRGSLLYNSIPNTND